MTDTSASYRPHDPGHDYHAPGIYLITLVTRGRTPLFGQLNDDIKAPAVVLSALGEAVMDKWAGIPAFEQTKGRAVKVHGCVCMPDHFHGIIEVTAPLDVSLGQIIWGFKVACTKHWRSLADAAQPSNAGPNAGPTAAGPNARPTTAEHTAPTSRPSLVDGSPLLSSDALHRLSKKQRAQYYAAHPEARQPLFDDNYDDTICLSDLVTGAYDQRHFSAMVRYVADNPRRAIIRRLRPQFMQRCLHVRIAGIDAQGQTIWRDYAAFGNLFLLRWARKVQVFCHRKAPDGHTPYEQTEAYRQQCAEWKRQVLQGATVIVTPGISAGERQIKDRCLECGYPLIHLQKEPIGPYWKPEQSRFDACSRGSLLILAPWQPEQLGTYNGVPAATDYSIFHNMNQLAAELCLFDGEARVVAEVM